MKQTGKYSTPKRPKQTSKRFSSSGVRSSPMIHIHAEDKSRVDGLADELKIFNFDALRLVIKAGLQAIEDKTVDVKRMQEESTGWL